MRGQTAKKRILASLLAVVMSVGLMVPAAFATGNGFVSETHDAFLRTTSTIAPGVTQDIVYAYAKDKKQMVYYIATADVNRDDVNVYANYKDNQCASFGMQKLTEQIAAAQAKHSNPEDAENYIENYNVVAGVNADFYNMTTGQPSGAFVMEGTVVTTANGRPFFGIQADGTAVIGRGNDDWASYNETSAIVEAVGGSQTLVWDGKDVTANASGSYNTDRHSRTCVGVTADGKVVMMVLDGRQEPFSCGGTMHELAQIMLEAGCVAAINLDGGGSTTFAAKQEGSDQVSIVNRPSDGSERSVSSSLMIVSTAAPSDVFDRAVLTADESYVTPGSKVSISAIGVSPAGTSAEIPEGVEWRLKDSSLGTVSDGVFVSNGTEGDAVVQMVYEGNVVGETVVHVVVPDAIAFETSTITIPYGKSAVIDVKGTYGLNEVVLKDGDVNLALEDDAVGSFDGMLFTACDESEGVTGCIITAQLSFDSGITATAQIVLGKGSEVVSDFEAEGSIDSLTIKTGYPQYGPMGSKLDENKNYYYNGQNEIGKLSLVTAENGKVHSGDTALAVECDFSQAYETGYHMLTMRDLGITVPANAQAIGMWIYVPELEELQTTSMRFSGRSEGSSTYDVSSPWLWDNCEPYGWENDGWRYVSMDLSGYSKAITFDILQIYICDRDNADVGFKFVDNASVNGRFTYYIDDITVDYSSVVDDREAPVFASVRYADTSMSDAVELNGQTVSANTISFGAVVHENTEKSNFTGLDDASVKAYIDGVEVESIYSGGTVSIQDAVLADGVHTVRFEASDKAGNVSYAERQITIAAGSGMSTVSLVPANPELDKILIGSVYWMNLVATDIEKVQSVSVDVNLNSVSQWQLEGMEVAPGFEAEYVIDNVTNNATITLNRVANDSATGETVLASLPIRTWESRLTEYEGYGDQTPEKLWSRKIIWPMDIKLSIKQGSIEFTDGTAGSFSMAPFSVITELYGNYAELNANGDYANKSSWHIHDAVAIEDKAATCNAAGYTGRTFCDICDSVVEWGEVVSATDHSYEVVDGLMKCVNADCGVLLTGEKDGIEYVGGMVVADGWNGDFYYLNGKKLTGVQEVEAPGSSDKFYYDFGENGVSSGKFTGLVELTDGYAYSAIGVLSSGWVSIDGDYYYFEKDTCRAAVGKRQLFAGFHYEFAENGELLSGVWYNDGNGTRYYYGPGYPQSRWMTHKDEKYLIGQKVADGDWYYFDGNGYRYEGKRYVLESNEKQGPQWYDFGQDGIAVASSETGLYIDGEKTYYLDNGRSAKGLVLAEDGYYYYFNSSDFTAVKNKTYWVSNPNATGIESDFYVFDAQGRMVVEGGDEPAPDPELRNGIVEEDGVLYYYENDVKVYAGLIEIDGSYYYVRSNGQLATGSYWVSKANGLMPNAWYEFGQDGKMVEI